MFWAYSRIYLSCFELSRKKKPSRDACPSSACNEEKHMSRHDNKLKPPLASFKTGNYYIWNIIYSLLSKGRAELLAVKKLGCWSLRKLILRMIGRGDGGSHMQTENTWNSMYCNTIELLFPLGLLYSYCSTSFWGRRQRTSFVGNPKRK